MCECACVHVHVCACARVCVCLCLSVSVCVYLGVKQAAKNIAPATNGVSAGESSPKDGGVGASAADDDDL